MEKKLFIKIGFNDTDEKLFTYLCPFDGVKVGDTVTVPVGKTNRVHTATVRDVALLSAGELNFPIERAKEVISVWKTYDLHIDIDQSISAESEEAARKKLTDMVVDPENYFDIFHKIEVVHKPKERLLDGMVTSLLRSLAVARAIDYFVTKFKNGDESDTTELSQIFQDFEDALKRLPAPCDKCDSDIANGFRYCPFCGRRR